MPQRSGVLVLLLAVLSTAQLEAQAPDSITFHRGQIGADFNVGNGFFGAGLIRFHSPTAAIVLDFNGFYSHASGSAPSMDGGATQSQLGVRLGSRHYGVLGSRLRRLLTVGVEGIYNHQTVDPDADIGITGVGGGAFLDLGASWFITPHLAVGASWGATARYNHTKETGATPPLTRTSNRVTVAVNRVALTGQLYF